MQNLSLHNQIALILQAGELQLALHDIRTEAGWARRGRRPKLGVPGLNVKRPHRPSDQFDDVVQYRAARRWEFSQTEPAGGGVRTQTEPAAAGDPADFAEHLRQQLDRLGYRVAPDSLTGIEHEQPVITIPESDWLNDPVAVVCRLIPELAYALLNPTGGTTPPD
ncbi:hypothetical protein AB0A63_13760 [Lentzea sp. NPDC042327]|uniref:hypothetical protein n=1 Tax=Lentzea sp. NPDC042327 TaxID=3154801 RepID=UPI0033CF7B65